MFMCIYLMIFDDEAKLFFFVAASTQQELLCQSRVSSFLPENKDMKLEGRCCRRHGNAVKPSALGLGNVGVERTGSRWDGGSLQWFDTECFVNNVNNLFKRLKLVQ